MKPLVVQIQGQSRLLLVSAGRKMEIECRSWGSRPPAEITWWRGSRRLPSAASRSVSQWANAPTTTQPTNLTISILSLTAEPEDDGQRLTCRADNLHLSNEAIEDSTILSVRCKCQTAGWPLPLESKHDLMLSVKVYFLQESDGALGPALL